MVNLIVAVSKNGIIGGNNTLLWKLPEDLKRFKYLTFGSNVIMGRKTFESIGKPLPGRNNIIITRDKKYKTPGCIIVNSLENAILKSDKNKKVFIIGGSQIYKEALSAGFVDKIYLTYIDKEFEGDAYFNFNDSIYIETERDDREISEFKYSFITYERRNKYR
jgi:dihydrofolate reductase